MVSLSMLVHAFVNMKINVMFVFTLALISVYAPFSQGDKES